MEDVSFSLSVNENGQIKSSFDVCLKHMGEGQYKPIIKVKSAEADFSTTIELPAADYQNLMAKIGRLVKDPQNIQRFTKTLLAVISLSSGGANSGGAK